MAASDAGVGPGGRSHDGNGRGHHQALGTVTLVLQLEPVGGQGAAPAPVFTNAVLGLLGGRDEGTADFPGIDYRPRVHGFADQRDGRWQDQSQPIKAGWRLKAARLLLDPAETALVTLNLADEEVRANDALGHHLSRLAGRIRQDLLRAVFQGVPASFVSALELHKSRTGAVFPVNPAFGAHVHLVIQVPADRVQELERWLLRYVGKAHGVALRRHGHEAPKLRELHDPDGGRCLRLDLSRRTVSTAHLRRNGTGLAANLRPVDPDARCARTGRPGLEGLLDYIGKGLHRLNDQLREHDLRHGAGQEGRRVRAQALHASDDVDGLAMRLYMDPEAACRRFLAKLEARNRPEPIDLDAIIRECLRS